MSTPASFDRSYDTALAIVGMAGRFPGASDIETFWQNIAAGVRSIRSFSDAELLAAGVDPELLRQPNYVKAGTVIDNIDSFDAGFFGYLPREAEIMDPQHRLFLECAWEALEHAAYDPETYAGLVGVFAGSAFSGYALHNIFSNPEIVDLVGSFQIDLNNNVDSLASTVSYKLNLRGPSIAVQTFCSTSLVAVHLACQSLLTYECDMALAGGAALTIPHGQGYLYQEGGIVSPDGHCRTFDAEAKGSVMSNGLGLVVLKRLKDALADGDQIYAVVRGSAVNNDGVRKVGFTAPGLAGQTSVIARALRRAGVKAETIDYMEAHGTATPLGDAVELAAMIKAFQRSTQRTQFCALGSVKPNIGHLDRASGVTGLIKTTLALKHRLLPPSLDFVAPSPEVDLAQSPFYVNTVATPWPITATPPRAGVSSFGLGGTNAHVVLEAAPEPIASTPAAPWQLLVLSAKTATALEAATDNLARYLRQHPTQNLADVAYTLQVGRAAFAQRRVLVCQDTAAGVRLLETRDPAQVLTTDQPSRERPVAFVFPDVGEQAVGLAQELYAQEPRFRATVDRCCALLPPDLGQEVRTACSAGTATTAGTDRTHTEPTVFVVSYALATLLQAWGVQPQAVLGTGIGEYVAATLAGVLSLEDALTLVATRARLTAALPADEARMDELTALARTLVLNPPQIPYLSTVTGTWITAAEATDPTYWARHMVAPARFADGVAALLATPEQVILEVGPGQALASFVKQHPACPRERFPQVISTLPAGHEHASDRAAVLLAIGKLWQLGVTIDWAGLHGQDRRMRLALPTYPFERQRFWIEGQRAAAASSASSAASGKRADIADWFYVPTWQPTPLPTSTPQSGSRWLIVGADTELGSALADHLVQSGQSVIQVHFGAAFAQRDATTFLVRSAEQSDYVTLFDMLRTQKLFPTHILHLGSLTSTAAASGPDDFRALQPYGLYSLLALAQALGPQLLDEPVQLFLVTHGLQAVNGLEPLIAEQAPLLGLGTVISQEYPAISCRSIDLLLPERQTEIPALAGQLAAEAAHTTQELAVAYRGETRWVRNYTSQRLAPPAASPLRQQGVYLITGGFGGVGRILTEYLARAVQAKLVLVGRTALPPRAEWPTILATQDLTTGVGQRVAQVQALEALGAEVLALPADVADAAQLAAVVAHTHAHFGGLHGVIHAAGISDSSSYGLIPDLGSTQCEAHFQPKVYGLYALDAALAEQSLDFCILFSSISTVLGGLGFGGYAAANVFIDAFVQRHNLRSTSRWTSVDWDTWQLMEKPSATMGVTVAQYEMLPDEGAQAFERVIASGVVGQIVNSTGDLDARIRQWVQLESLRPSSATNAPSDRAERVSGPPMQTQVAYEQRIQAIWQEVLGLTEVGLHENFFELGGNSLVALQVIATLKKAFQVPVPAVALFEAPTVSALAQYLLPAPPPLADQQRSVLATRRDHARQRTSGGEIAIIAMAGRFPGADTVEHFWANLRDGVESLRWFSDAELLAAGVDPLLVQHPQYVKARPVLGDVTGFDAAFFGYTPREAELMDPQQRLFHECAWEALERAGYDTQRFPGLVGVFAGSNFSSYLMQMIGDPELLGQLNDAISLENDKDALTTNVSYKLNLRGPSFAVQTYCSTSLVATHLACRSLRDGECDIALAGGVSVRVPVEAGYLYQEGDQASPDGHCRTFDAQAKGANFGDGVALVVLKRLDDALADGDTIHAVIKGSAVNNDGGLKVGYTAPSVVGQAEVVLAALADAAVDPATIGYVEAHGTATTLGDPIEVASLTKAYRAHTAAQGYCVIGSVKPNVGHLDRAAGVTGLIKTVLALKHGLLPATLHYTAPNPEIDFASSPFVVSPTPRLWPAQAQPRRAGVNSLGVGGTNAHVIVEEAPPRSAPSSAPPAHLLLLSAKTATALDAATANLHAFLAATPDVELADVAYTLQVGRRVFEHRRALVCHDRDQALAALAQPDRAPVRSAVQAAVSRPVAFMFPGVGDHYVGMAQALYTHEPSFRATVDRCCALLQPHLGRELRKLLYPSDAPTVTTTPAATPDLRALLGRTGGGTTDDGLRDTAVAQPAVFVVEYALAQLLMSWGVEPQALLGYSVGEYVAATLAGVLSLEDALKLVATRARLIAALPAGAMLTVFLSEAAVQPFLSASVNLAVVTSPTTCVLAGPPSDLDALAAQLRAQDIACRPVATTHAFHSTQLAPLMDEVTALVRTLSLHSPQIPYLSNVTGTWITEAEATDPTYWARHMVEPVRFADGVAALLATPEQVILEVGPGQALASFVKQHPACARERFPQVISTLPAAQAQGDALTTVLEALGALWLLDVPIAWEQRTAHAPRMRIPLPTYPFERQRFWVAPNPEATSRSTAPRRADITSWFATASWKRSDAISAVVAPTTMPPETWLLLVDGCGVGSGLAQWLQARQQTVILVTPAAGFTVQGTQQYGVRPAVRADYEALLRTLATQGRLPQHVVHLWSVREPTATVALAEGLAQGFDSLLALTQALGDQGVERCEMVVVSTGVQEVTGGEALDPVRATVLGPCKVIPQEYTTLTSRSIDLVLPPTGQANTALVEHLAHELISNSADDVVALRGSHRWVQTFDSVAIPPPTTAPSSLRQQGVYLITGGLGGIGLALAEYLATTVQAKLALVGRTALPPRAEWPAILATEDQTMGVGRRVAQVQALEARGIEVLVLHADVADAAQLAAAVAQTRAHFGALHGVFHTAGVPGVGLMQLKTAEAAANVLAPKVHGTLALAQALRDVPLDFLVLFSSITSATSGGPGQADYCAANAFLDAYARCHARDHGRTIAISWGEWLWDAWHDGLQGYPEEVRTYLIANRKAYGISFPEGMEALQRILASRLSHVFVTTQDLNWMVEKSRRSSAAVEFKKHQEQQQSRPKYPRPVLGTTYVAPRNKLEEQIAAVWSTTLVLEQVGIDDNFFELGGNSLLGLDLTSKIRKELKLEKLPSYVLYEAPTIGALAEYISQTQQEVVADDELKNRGDKRKAQLQHLQRRAHTEEVL